MYAVSRKAFTLIELLVVIAIIAVLAVVVVLTLNPQALLQQSRDSNRLSDVNTITDALNVYNEDQGGAKGYSLGTSGVTYLSIPDPTATTTAGTNCAGLGFSGNYQCPASSTYRNVNGTGWIPVDLASTTGGSPLSVLPVDPTNTTSSGEYYEYMTNGTQFEVAGYPESQKYTPQCSSFAQGSSQTLINRCQTTYVVTTVGAGSWTIPAGVTSVQVQLWGGGGGGVTGEAYTGSAAAYVNETGLTVTPGNSITYVVASGGSGSASATGGAGGTGYQSGGNGANETTYGGGGGGGSTSVVVNGTTYIASGGGGGGYNGGTSASGSSGGTGSNGSGIHPYAGGGGGSGTAGGNGSGNTGGAGGTGGTTQTGTNGTPFPLNSSPSSAGASGNGNSGSPSNGGAGSGGAVGGTVSTPGGANGSGSDSGGGAYISGGGSGGQPGAGGGGGGSSAGGNGGAGELVITYTL